MSDKTLVLAQGRMQGFGATRDLLQPKPAVAAVSQQPAEQAKAVSRRSAVRRPKGRHAMKAGPCRIWWTTIGA